MHQQSHRYQLGTFQCGVSTFGIHVKNCIGSMTWKNGPVTTVPYTTVYNIYIYMFTTLYIYVYPYIYPPLRPSFALRCVAVAFFLRRDKTPAVVAQRALGVGIQLWTWALVYSYYQQPQVLRHRASPGDGRKWLLTTPEKMVPWGPKIF